MEFWTLLMPAGTGDVAAPAADEVVKAVQVAAQAQGPARALAIAAMLSIVLRFAMTFVGPKLALFNKHPNAYRIAGLAIGVAVFGLEKFAMGSDIWSAITAALGGPGAVMFNEYMKMKPAKAEAAVEAVAGPAVAAPEAPAPPPAA